MGNQLSADKEKEKERVEKDRLERDRVERDRVEKDRLEKQGKGASVGAPRTERQRSRTITSTPCPPTETKVNVNAEQLIVPLERPISSLPGTPCVGHTTPLAERRTAGKSTAAKEVISAVKNLNMKELPKPTKEEIRKEAEEMEATPKFETVRVPSETSVLDEEDLKEIDEGMRHLLDRN